MYKDGYLSYNPIATNEAISASMKAESISSISGKLSSVSVPASFKSKGRLTSTLNSIKTTINSMTNLSSSIKSMQNIMEEYVNDESLNELSTTLKGYSYIELEDGNRGYLYIPEGYNSTKGLPLVVYLAGQGQDSMEASRGKTKALGYLLNNGYKLDAVAFVPIGRGTNWGVDPTLEMIDNVANKYQVDKDRISLIGYSWGACVGYEMIEKKPDYFSAFVPFGGFARVLFSPERTSTIANSSTKYLIYHSTYDQAYNKCINTYNALKTNGAQVAMYEFTGPGGSHYNINEVFSDEMLNDIINIRKNEKYSGIPNEIVKIDIEEAKIMSAKYELDNNVDNKITYYVPLTNGNNRSVASVTPSEPETSVTPSEPETPLTPSEPETPVTPSKPETPVTPSKPETPVAPSKPTTPVTPSKPTTPVTPSKPTTPVTPSEPINILPENKFSSALPKITNGEVNSMEISNSFVSYNINNIQEKNYEDYLMELEKAGYELIDNKWVKGEYEIELNYDNNMLSLNVNINK